MHKIITYAPDVLPILMFRRDGILEVLCDGGRGLPGAD